MSFSDLQEKHQSFIAGHALGETIDYLPHGEVEWDQIHAFVRRAPIDTIEGVRRSSVSVVVSKADVPVVHRRRDSLRLPADQDAIEGTPPRYRVQEAIELPGGWRLQCERVN